MNWPIILAFGAMVGWGVGDFLIQKTTRKIGTIETLFWITFFSSFFLLPFVIRDLIKLNSREIIILAILGIANFSCAFLFFKALRVGKLAVVETILSIELPLTILLGIFIFGEKINLFQGFLLFCLLIGIILISVDFKKINRQDFLEKGAWLTLGAAGLSALVNFLTASQAKEISPLMAIWLPWLVCGLVCLVYLSRKPFLITLKNSQQNWKLILFMVIVDTLAWLAYVFAVEKKELSITIAITQSFLVLALILGVLINKEKIRTVQYIGALLALGGSVLIGLI